MGIKTKIRKRFSKLYTQCEDRLCWADSTRWLKKEVSPNRYRVRCKCGKFIGYHTQEERK